MPRRSPDARPVARERADPDNGLRKLFQERLPQVHWVPIELGVLVSGVPDHNGCWSGSDWWAEYKATDTHAVGLESLQVGWALRRCRVGGRAFVITRRAHDGGPRRGSPVDELWIHEGWDAPALREYGLQAAPPVRVDHGGPDAWDWGSVLGVLAFWEFSRR